MESWAEKDSYSLRNEGNAKGASAGEEECTLCHEWKEVFKLDISSLFGEHELCIWRPREPLLGYRPDARRRSEISPGQAQKV